MDFQELVQIYDRIVNGYVVINIGEKSYAIYDVNTHIRYKLENYYQLALERYSFTDILSEEQAKNLLKIRKIWNASEEKELDLLQNKLTALKSKKTKTKSDILYTQLQIDNLENQIKKKEKQKDCLLTSSAEYFAQLEKLKMLLFHNTYLNDVRAWSSLEQFEGEKPSLINLLIEKYTSLEHLKESQIRKLARSEPWRSIWLGSTKVGNLFGQTPMVSLTDYQRVLISWSLIYDSVYENPERPSEDIINDDESLDLWLKGQNKKMGISKKDSESTELGIVVPPEEAAAIYAMNSGESMKTIAKREKALREKEVLKESELPDVKAELQMKANRQFKEHVNG